MTTWTIFGLGIVAGVIWSGLSIITAAWFYRAKSHERIYRQNSV